MFNPMYKPGTDKSSESDDDHVQSCENRKCSGELFAACPIVACQNLLCYDHFLGRDPCRNHNQNCNIEGRSNHVDPQPSKEHADNRVLQPEDFEVEGPPRQ